MGPKKIARPLGIPQKKKKRCPKKVRYRGPPKKSPEKEKNRREKKKHMGRSREPHKKKHQHKEKPDSSHTD